MRRILVVLTLAVAVAGCGSSKKTVHGTGYAFTLPAKWRDAQATLNASATQVDNAFVNPAATGIPKENIVVIRESPPGVKDNQLGVVDKTFRGQAATLADSKGVEPSRRLELDGSAAETYAYVMREGGGIGRQRQEFTIHKGAVYTITWTAPSRDFAKSERLLEQILASWRWTK